MRTFAQKQNQPQKSVISSLARSNIAKPRPDHCEHPILHLQRAIGNQAVQRMLQTHAEEPEARSTAAASPRFGHDFSRIPVHPPAAEAIQTKLAINKPGDEYEQEADRVSEQVMRLPEPQLRRACACGGACPKCQTEHPGYSHERLQTQRVGSNDLKKTPVPHIVHEVLASPGQPLDSAARAFMEPRFGHDFSRVRVHTDARAAESARAVNALAYTVGQDLVFNHGQYEPGTLDGKRLLAHELTHVSQQSEAPQREGVAQRQPGGSGSALSSPPASATVFHSGVNHGHTPSGRWADVQANPNGLLLQRQIAPTGTGGTIDARANDPNFLLCLALCELGIPPSLWRTVLNEILSAASQEYRDRLGDLRGSQEFESFRAELTVMSTFNKLKLVIGFLGESRIGFLTIERPAAQAIRRALLARLAARGLESATLQVVSQILRKVAIAIEVAVAAGCTTYCGAMTMVNALLDFSSAALGAISSFINVASQFGAALGQAIARPILIARASMDPANWDLTALPTRSRAHMNLIGLAFRLAFSPDSFLASMGRPLSTYNIPQILAELAQDINTTLQARGGFAQLVTFTADFIGRLTPLQFVQILKDYRLLMFVQDPEVLADLEQAQQAVMQP